MATTEENPHSFHEPPSFLSPPGGRPHQYEFTPKEDEIIGKLGSKMHFLGLTMLVFGLFTLIVGVASRHPGIIVVSAIVLTVGIFTLTAAKSFLTVVETQGHDISNLMVALDNLRKACTFQYAIFLVAIVVVILLAILSATNVLAI
jgi:hypothetical protein